MKINRMAMIKARKRRVMRDAELRKSAVRYDYAGIAYYIVRLGVEWRVFFEGRRKCLVPTGIVAAVSHMCIARIWLHAAEKSNHEAY